MKRNNIYQEVVDATYDQTPTIANVRILLQETDGVLDTDNIEIQGWYSSTSPGKILIWRHREETDDEYEQRIEKEKNMVDAVSSTLTAISKGELKVLREKAAKYDDLCK